MNDMSIIARKVKVIMKDGIEFNYTHLIDFYTKDKFLYIQGETYNFIGMPMNIYDKIPIEQINITYIEWYIPKE